jgi:hypothetical protein
MQGRLVLYTNVHYTQLNTLFYFSMNFRDSNKVGIVYKCTLYTAEYIILFFYKFQGCKEGWYYTLMHYTELNTVLIMMNQ